MFKTPVKTFPYISYLIREALSYTLPPLRGIQQDLYAEHAQAYHSQTHFFKVPRSKM